jgi:hypothetical protein
MVESGRKHGPFDLRYPVRQKIATPVWELQGDRDGQGRLEWSVFLARFFTNRRRHDFEALAAYESYTNALDRAALRSSPRRRPAFSRGRRAGRRGVVSSRPCAEGLVTPSGAIAAARTVSPSPALADWEPEGGGLERDSD